MIQLLLPIACGYATHLISFEIFKSVYKKTEEERNPMEMAIIIHGTLLVSFITVMICSLAIK